MPRFDLAGAVKRCNTSGGVPASALQILAVSFGFTFAAFAVFALLFAYTGLPDSMIGAVVFVTMVIAMMLSGFTAGRKANTRGWLNGALGGLLYVVVLYVTGVTFFTGVVFDKYVLSLLAVGFLSGAAGGIIGINVKKK